MKHISKSSSHARTESKRSFCRREQPNRVPRGLCQTGCRAASKSKQLVNTASEHSWRDVRQESAYRSLYHTTRYRCTETYGQRLKELQKYKEQHGGCVMVPCDEPTGLGRWLAEQRHRWRKGLLELDTYRELSSMGVPMNAQDARWEDRFQQLKEWQQGDRVVVRRQDCASSGLYEWVLLQRQLKRQGRLRSDRLKKLEGIGFVFNVKEFNWRERLKDMLSFYKEYGHVKIPKGWKTSPKLYAWMNTVQQSSKYGFRDCPFVTKEDVEVLTACGAIKATRRTWKQQYCRLLEIKHRAWSRLRVPYDEIKASGLVEWARYQRYLYRHDLMHADRVELLDAVGFNWDDGDWHWMISSLLGRPREEQCIVYQEHCRV